MRSTLHSANEVSMNTIMVVMNMDGRQLQGVLISSFALFLCYN
jgi:hypothetical protein